MKLTSGSRQAGFSIRPLTTDAQPDSGEVVRITLDEPTDSPARVELSATLAQGGAAGRFEALGFEVLEAFQQGTVMVTTAAGWTTQPVNPQGVNRINAPPDAPPGTWQYAFENRDRSLTVHISPAKSRLHIQPVYVAHVVRGQIGLRAEFLCRLGGADLGGSLSLQLPGWTVRDVASDRLADLNSIDLSAVEPLEIPLTRTSDTAREFTIVVDAARQLPDDANRVEFKFPRIMPPANATVTTSAAKLVVTSADEVELTPDVGELQGLASAYGDGTTGLVPPDLQQAPLFYTDLVGEDTPKFVADMTLHAQSISADVHSTLTLGASQLGVEQQITHRIAYVPVRHLLLDAPTAILEPNARLAITWNDVPLNAASVDQPTLPGRTVLQVELNEPVIGDCELKVSYRLPDPDPLAGELAAPLTLPLADSLMTHRLELSVEDDLQMDASLDTAWLPDLAEEAVYVSQGDGSQATIRLRARQAAAPSDTTLVLKTWLQSWLQDNLRRDRAAFRIRSDQSEVQIQLPAGLEETSVVLNTAVDGRRVVEQFDSQTHILSVPLPDSDEHVVEIWYSLLPPPEQSWLGAPTLDPPHLINAVELGQSYWQIFVPDGQQLVAPPSNLTADMEWRWEGGVYQQLASLETRDLEQWVGASQQEPLPAGLKPYSFTTSGGLPQITFQLTSLKRLTLLGAFLVMLIVWASMAWPALRRPTSLAVWGFCLIALAIGFPSLAFGLGQAVLLAAVLVAAGQLLRQALLPAVSVASESVSEAITRRALPVPVGGESGHGTTASNFPISMEAKP